MSCSGWRSWHAGSLLGGVPAGHHDHPQQPHRAGPPGLVSADRRTDAGILAMGDRAASVVAVAPVGHPHTILRRRGTGAAKSADGRVRRLQVSLRADGHQRRGGIGTFIEIPLTVMAPWLLGIAARRVGGLVVVLFRHLEDGHGPGPDDDMLQLYRPRLLAMATREALPRPEATAAQAESLLRWWVQRLNEFFEVVLDPANYRIQADWSYDPRSHLGTLLTVDRLLACVLGVLVDTGRNEFIRKLLLFDTLDLLDGLYQGGYDQLCKHSVVEQRLMLLTETLPPDIGSLLLPRCQRAADALHSLQDGFFLTERLGSTGLQMQRPKGAGLQTRPLEGATAAYLRVVRNASHSFRDMIRKAPDDISLLAAHDGELPAELADLAFLHFLYLLVAPTTLLPGWLRKAK